MIRKSLFGLALSMCLPFGHSLSAQSYDADLVIAVPNMMNTFDPHMSASVGTDLSLLSHIYPSLVLRGPDLAIIPALATSWEAVDATTWRFTLHEGAAFSNGEKLDAEAVKWNIERILNPDKGARIRSWLTSVSEVTVESPTTLVLKTSTPFPALIEQLSMVLLLPPVWAEANDPAKTFAAGGPYEVVDLVQGDSVRLRRNPSYFGAPAPFETVVFRVIPDAGSRMAAMQAGEVDFVHNIPTEALAGLDAGPGAAGSVPSTRTVFIKLNAQKAPLDNKAFRQALNYAVDKALIAEAIFDGQASVASCQLTSPAYFGHNPALSAYPYDPEKAKALIAESGYDGAPIDFQIATGTFLNGNEVVEAIAADLAAVGVETKIEELQYGVYMDRYLKEKTLGSLSINSYGWPTLDADGILSLLGTASPYAYYSNTKVDEALAIGRATLDKAARLKAYTTATTELCDDAALLYLYVQPTTYATSARVTWSARGDDWIRAFDMQPAQ